MNKVQFNLIETGKSDPATNLLQRIANVLDINVVEFFEAKNNGTEVQTVNEPLLLHLILNSFMKQSEVWLLDPTKGAEIQKNRPAIILNDDRLGKLPIKKLCRLPTGKTATILPPGW